MKNSKKTKNKKGTIKNDNYTSEDHSYKSVSVIYTLATDEYKTEIGRTSILDGKIGIMLPISATYFFLLIGTDKIIDSVKKLYLTPFSFDMNFVREIVSVMCLVLALISMLLFAVAIATRRYDVVDTSEFNSLDYFCKDEAEFKAVFITVLLNAADNNKKVNDKRARKHFVGVIMVLLSLLLYFTAILLQ